MNYQFVGFIPTAGYSLGTGVMPRVEVRRRITVKQIQEIVADFYDIPVFHMTSESREASHAQPRQMAMYLVREMLGRSTPDIGRRFGNRDHTTVIHALSAVKKRMARNEEYQEDAEYLKQKVMLA